MMYVVTYETLSLYAVQANVCNRCLRFIPIETKMAQVKEFLKAGEVISLNAQSIGLIALFKYVQNCILF